MLPVPMCPRWRCRGMGTSLLTRMTVWRTRRLRSWGWLLLRPSRVLTGRCPRLAAGGTTRPSRSHPCQDMVSSQAWTAWLSTGPRRTWPQCMSALCLCRLWRWRMRRTKRWQRPMWTRGKWRRTGRQLVCLPSWQATPTLMTTMSRRRGGRVHVASLLAPPLLPLPLPFRRLQPLILPHKTRRTSRKTPRTLPQRTPLGSWPAGARSSQPLTRLHEPVRRQPRPRHRGALLMDMASLGSDRTGTRRAPRS